MKLIQWEIIVGLLGSVLGMKGDKVVELLVMQVVGYACGLALGCFLAHIQRKGENSSIATTLRTKINKGVAAVPLFGLIATAAIVSSQTPWYFVLVTQLTANLMGLAIACSFPRPSQNRF